MSLEMFEGICVTSKLSGWQMRWVPLIELVSTPGLISISEPGAKAAAVLIITFINIIRIITIVSALSPRLSYFKFKVLHHHLLFSCLCLHVRRPSLSVRPLWVDLRVGERSVRFFGTSCHAVMSDGGVWKALWACEEVGGLYCVGVYCMCVRTCSSPKHVFIEPTLINSNSCFNSFPLKLTKYSQLKIIKQDGNANRPMLCSNTA